MFRVRWLGRVRYQDGYALQRALWARAGDDYLLLLEHPHVYTLGLRGDPAHVLVQPASVGAELVQTNRGGDVTYHGPGQLVGYPILTLTDTAGAMPDTPAYIHAVEDVLIEALAALGLPGCGRIAAYPGVWVDADGAAPRKIAAIGTRISRRRSMHGFALNVAPDMGMFENIVPCGITELGVTSLATEGLRVSMRDVVDAVATRAAARWAKAGPMDGTERTDVAWRDAPADLGALAFRPRNGSGRLIARLHDAGVEARDGLPLAERKPSWLRVRADLGPDYRALKSTVRELGLVTVCEEAGCPNIFECWADGTATFMINGQRCTRACGFCLVDTRHPIALDDSEPERVAAAVQRLGLAHAVVTAVARDDLPDGGAAAFARTIHAIRAQCPGTAVEVLVPDFQGDPDSLRLVFDARPEVLNHNLETVARLQRAVRPSASYARSLSVLARAKDAGLTTKSGLILGMGETDDEIVAALADLRAVGVDIVTMGQYLRPTAQHLPVARWVTPEVFDGLRAAARSFGFAHVEASPLTRSSYHARQAAGGAEGTAHLGRAGALAASIGATRP